MENKKGVSLLECFLVLSIIVILSTFTVPSIQKLYRTYKFNEYAFKLESLVRWAKITAIEKGINVSICVSERNILVYNETTSRDPSCSGNVLKVLKITDDWIDSNIKVSLNNIKVSLNKAGLMFDPRGLAIFGGNVCISDGSRYYKVVLQSGRGAITIKSGEGGCS